jgi:uncharacterized protein
MTQSSAVPGQRNRIRRHPERGAYGRSEAYATLDAGQIGHVGFVVDGQPFVIPMLYARQGDSVLLHGNVASRLLRHLATGAPCCISVTHMDGWVLARSHFNHSANYRSVVVFGTARSIDDPERKAIALLHLVEALLPGRGADTRPADPQELAGTSLLEVEISECSVKSRSGPPKDHPDDLSWPTWAGVVPLTLSAGTPIPAPDLLPGVALPEYLQRARTDPE